jgi:hypothetical protein
MLMKADSTQVNVNVEQLENSGKNIFEREGWIGFLSFMAL